MGWDFAKKKPPSHVINRGRSLRPVQRSGSFVDPIAISSLFTGHCPHGSFGFYRHVYEIKIRTPLVHSSCPANRHAKPGFDGKRQGQSEPRESATGKAAYAIAETKGGKVRNVKTRCPGQWLISLEKKISHRVRFQLCF
jgi:hypothetical protein